MRIYQLLVFFFITNVQTSNSQTFEQAPKAKKPIKKIVEWVSNDIKSKAGQGYVYHFDKKGKIQSFVGSGDIEQQTIYTYDEEERLLSIHETGKDLDIETKYFYGNISKEEIVTYRTRKYQTIDFFDKEKKLVERKINIQGEDVGGKWTLKDRIIYTYYSDNLLKGEVHYSYRVQGGGSKVLKRKVIYTYDSKTKKKRQVKYFDYDNSIRMATHFNYDQKGNLTLEQSTDENSSVIKQTEYLYKNNLLWQEIRLDGNEKSVKIYKNGLLIRLRTYNDDQILKIIDYQYVYF